jgi:tight adherence protein B
MHLAYIIVIIFFITLFTTELLILAYKNAKNPNRSKIRKRLGSLETMSYEQQNTSIIEKKLLSNIPILDAILQKTPRIQSLFLLTRKANAKYHVGYYILLGLVLSSLGYVFSTLLVKNIYLGLLCGAFLFSSPFVYLMYKKKRRMNKLYEQLPDTLELISRALKAGHAFTGSMKLVADEFPDPIGPEFAETLAEINFGISVQDALKNLANRVDCSEMKYFVVAVSIQRSTGGNLTEILDTLAYLIRERFKLRGKIRTLSAEGKFSAIVLLALPIVLLITMYFLNPNYITILFIEPAGKIMLIVASILMIVGTIVMKKMINIKV